ncbi:hypothetical protein HIM_08325 [Hirsutella minnesotensis 3608]|uniref:Uncharacterized protein n=1 Tax=Hirsutella minnesotensis 3608 TaxID=1043627 RepID=A0A0F8A3R4_9HYPO|nr:hypothetical protein HIM_08325 [Hirsutella minnesotensis 3608]
MGWWYLKGATKFGAANLLDVNSYGMPEVAPRDYVRDAFEVAQKDKQRVFCHTSRERLTTALASLRKRQ